MNRMHRNHCKYIPIISNNRIRNDFKAVLLFFQKPEFPVSNQSMGIPGS
jgi:hypothetical protein